MDSSFAPTVRVDDLLQKLAIIRKVKRLSEKTESLFEIFWPKTDLLNRSDKVSNLEYFSKNRKKATSKTWFSRRPFRYTINGLVPQCYIDSGRG